jgi:hypothetical protein
MKSNPPRRIAAETPSTVELRDHSRGGNEQVGRHPPFEGNSNCRQSLGVWVSGTCPSSTAGIRARATRRNRRGDAGRRVEAAGDGKRDRRGEGGSAEGRVEGVSVEKGPIWEGSRRQASSPVSPRRRDASAGLLLLENARELIRIPYCLGNYSKKRPPTRTIGGIINPDARKQVSGLLLVPRLSRRRSSKMIKTVVRLVEIRQRADEIAAGFTPCIAEY